MARDAEVIIDLEIRVNLTDYADLDMVSAVDTLRGFGSVEVKNVRTEEK